jgi:D-alanine transaminase
MDRIVYVNGQYLPEQQAKISVFDRGFLFADAVYEVSAVLGGRLVDNDHHLRRLRRSLRELGMDAPAGDDEIESIQKELIRRNELNEGIVYLQVTRGAADRDFAYPENSHPSLVLFTQAKNILANPLAQTGLEVVTTADLRWARRDIKTVALLAASMAKMAALSAGADDAWLVDGDGLITEGSSCNAYIVTAEGIITRNLSQDILPGITRRAVLQLAEESGLQVIERPFSVHEAHQAEEAFITAAGIFVLPVVKVDDHLLGNGKPGPVTLKMRELYIAMALS